MTKDPEWESRLAAQQQKQAEAPVAHEYRKHCARRFPQARILELTASGIAAAASAVTKQEGTDQ